MTAAILVIATIFLEFKQIQQAAHAMPFNVGSQ
jgi:hypothetical protein